MAGAVGEARDRFVAAKSEIRLAWIADRPTALARRISSSEQGCTLSTVAGFGFRTGAPGTSKHQAQNWRCGDTAAAGRVEGKNAPAPAGRPGERPRRWILPMTALRVTPIWAAIWLQVRPEVTQFRSCSTRSAVQGSDAKEQAIALGHASSRLVSFSWYRAWNGLAKCSGRSGPPSGRRPRNGCRGAAGRSSAHSAREREILHGSMRRVHRAASALLRLQARRFEWDPYAD